MDAAVVVVVDDRAELRALVAAVLRALPEVEVRGAADGERALRVLREVRARVVLLDMEMPVMDGFATVRAIRADPALRALPVVGMSAGDNGEAARAAGCDAFVPKPFGRHELLAALRPYLPPPGD